MKLLAILALLLTLTACSGNGEVPAELAESPTETKEAIPAELLFGGEVITLTAADGVEIIAELLLVEGAAPRGGVVLTHMLGQQRGDWEPLVELLITHGFDVIAVDLRGHGQSAGELSFRDFDTADWLACVGDISAAIEPLALNAREYSIFLIGGSIGANLSLLTAAEDGRVDGVVLLSPGLDYRGVEPLTVAYKYLSRPVMLVAAEDDPYSKEAVKELDCKLTNASTIIYPSGGHGTNLLTSRPELSETLIDWLVSQLN